MTRPDYSIKQVSWQDYKSTLLEIRLPVFVTEQAVPIELEIDEFDADALHLLVEDKDQNPIATARMLSDGHIGRMAVLIPWRTQGIGSAMLNQLLDIAEQKGIHDVFLNAQCAAESFYQKMGFIVEGEIFDDAGIPHIKMRKHI